MRRGPGLRAVLVSAAIHGLVLAPVVVFARAPEPILFETVKLNLVSLPPAEAEAAPAVVETQRRPEPEPEPEPEPPQPEPDPDPEVVVEEEPPPEPPEKEPEPQKTEAPPEPQKTAPEPETPTTERGGDGIDIATEGREFPYPDYLANVIVQVKRYFRWSDSSRPKALIYFEITGDGSVRNIRMVRSSGNVRFDFAAQGAVETAGTRGEFGPLPEGYAAPVLPVQMEIEPPR